MKRDSSVQNIYDHREIGKQYQLFSFVPEGPGMPFFLEKGLILKNLLKEFWRKEHRKRSYQEIESPILLSRKLWEKSGHWDLFQENMFQSQVDKKEYAIKPMSCPGAILVYQSKKRSHRELPLRLCELGHVHRHEDSGSLHGLLRVRSFVQDDAHLFCRPDQLESEICQILDLCQFILKRCGFEHFEIELSVRDPKKNKYLGEDHEWIQAEEALKKALKSQGFPFREKKGEAKFYGPAIDLHIKDANGKKWQCSSVQLDFNLSKRFDVCYYDEKGEKQIPFILHRAIFGSLERFIGILLENYGIDLPFWLVPEQFRIISINEEDLPYAEEVKRQLLEKGFRCSIDSRFENLSSSIKKSIAEGVPYSIILGEKERREKKISLRSKKGRMRSLIELEDLMLLG